MSGGTVIALCGLHTFTGRGLAHALKEHGGPRLIGSDTRPLRDGLLDVFCRIDLTQPSAAEELAALWRRERVDCVVHTAYREWPTADHEADRDLETIGTLQMLHACAGAGVKRVVIESHTALYGPHPENPNFVDESSPLRGHPAAHCIANRIEVERMAELWQKRHPDIALAILRPCWVMGPGVAHRAAQHFRKPVVTTLLGYDPLLQFVHPDDCLRAFCGAALSEERGVWNVVGSDPLPLSVLLRAAGKRCLKLPPSLLYRLRNLPERARHGDPPAAFFDYLRYLWVADGERAWSTYGEPRYSTREAWMAFHGAERQGRYA